MAKRITPILTFPHQGGRKFLKGGGFFNKEKVVRGRIKTGPTLKKHWKSVEYEC
jgi:hypothetical protein